MELWAIIVFFATLLFSVGGVYAMFKNALKRLDRHDERLDGHEAHFSRHDVVFEKIIVGQDYIIKQLDEQKDRMVRVEDKLDGTR